VLHPLLSIVFAFLIAEGGVCSIPSDYMNSVSHTDGGITYTFAVDKFYYTDQDTIRFCYLVENTGTDTVTFDFDTEEQCAFRVYPDTCTSFCQAGCLDSALYYEPVIVHLYPSSFSLPPGQCRSYSSSWHVGTRVTPGPAPTPGKYRAFGGLWRNDSSPCFGQLIEPTGLSVDFMIEGIPVGTDDKSWGEIKGIFK